MVVKHIVPSIANSTNMGNMGSVCYFIRRQYCYKVKKMSNLTIQALKAKIETVDIDIQKLQGDGENIRKVETLIEYKKYLQDELTSLEKGST
jgi:hypothetical protein